MGESVGDRSAIVWSWTDAYRGLAYSVPAVAVTVLDPAHGVPLALGVLPACLLPLPGPRRGRVVIAVIGAVCGASLLAGGALAHLPTAVTALMLVAIVVIAAVAADRRPGGMLLLVLAAPLTAVGLSFVDWESAVGAALLLSAGAVYAWLVSLLWPSRAPLPRPPVVPSPPGDMVRYGLFLGTGAAVAFLITAGLGLDHPGWAPAACLLVARPDAALLRSRALGRALAVTAGAFAGAAVVWAQPPSLLLAGVAATVVAAAAATRASRWYITSVFTTFLVFVMLLQPHPEQTTQKIGERVAETLLGVALAIACGIGLPALAARAPRLRPDDA